MGCTFCATGQGGFTRQLSSEEIFEQVAELDSFVKRAGGSGLSNIVFMGMGEPLGNYKAVMSAIERIKGEIGISPRRITVSTVGLPPNIRKLADSNVPCNLAVSLHESDCEKRSKLMPANRRYGGLDEVSLSVNYVSIKCIWPPSLPQLSIHQSHH